MMVVVIIGLIGVFAFPSIRKASDNVNTTSARDIVATYASTARRAAQTRASVTRLRVTSDSILTVVMDDPAGERTVAAPVNLELDYGVQVALTLADGTPLGTNEIVFDKRGLARDIGNQTRKIVVAGVSSGLRDSVCISGAGMVLRGTCR
jgi:Tfp pilus assembly protein FimT